MYRDFTITTAVFILNLNVVCCNIYYCAVLLYYISGEGEEILLVASDRLSRAIV